MKFNKKNKRIVVIAIIFIFIASSVLVYLPRNKADRSTIKITSDEGKEIENSNENQNIADDNYNVQENIDKIYNLKDDIELVSVGDSKSITAGEYQNNLEFLKFIEKNKYDIESFTNNHLIQLKNQALNDLITFKLIELNLEDSNLTPNLENIKNQKAELLKNIESDLELKSFMDTANLTDNFIEERLIADAYAKKMFELINNSLTKEDIDSIEDKVIEMNFSHILLKDIDKAKEVEKKIKSSNFEHLATEYSIDEQTKNNGGLLGTYMPGAFGKKIDETVLNMDVGSVSGLIQTEYGYQFFKLNELNTLKDVREKGIEKERITQYENYLIEQMERQKFQNKIMELEEKYKIEVKKEI